MTGGILLRSTFPESAHELRVVQNPLWKTSMVTELVATISEIVYRFNLTPIDTMVLLEDRRGVEMSPEQRASVLEDVQDVLTHLHLFIVNDEFAFFGRSGEEVLRLSGFEGSVQEVSLREGFDILHALGSTQRCPTYTSNDPRYDYQRLISVENTEDPALFMVSPTKNQLSRFVGGNPYHAYIPTLRETQ